MIKAQGGIRKSGILSPWRNPFEPSDRRFRRAAQVYGSFRFIRTGGPDSYYVLDQPVVIEEGEEFSVELVADLSVTGGYLISDSGESFRLAYDDGGSLILTVTENGVPVDYIEPGVFTAAQDGQAHSVEFKRDNGFLVLSVDGVAKYSLFSSAAMTFDAVFKAWEPVQQQRYFTRIDASTKGFSLPTPISLTSGPVAIRVRMAFLGVISGRVRPAFGGKAYIELDAFSDSVDFVYNYSGPSSGLSEHESLYGDGSMVEYLLTYNGSTVEGFINGISTGTTARAPSAQTIDSFFATGSSGSSVIYPLSAEVWSGTDDVNAAPSFSCLFDSDGTGVTETDTVGGKNLTRVGLTAADTELFTLNSIDNQWENSDQSIILPVAY